MATKTKKPITKPKPKRSPIGHFLPGNQESIGNSGKPCQYCEHKEEIDRKIELYSQWTLGNVGPNKIYQFPMLEELCDEEYLDIHTDTMTDWTHSEHSLANHSELILAIRQLLMRQKKYLLKHTMTASQVTGAIFQLKANHGMIETEKKILAGTGPQEKLVIEIVEEENKHGGE